MQKAEVALLSAGGKLLIIPAQDIPQMAKGKGNKLWGGKDRLLAAACIAKGDRLQVHAAQRCLTLKGKELAAYRGERAQAGKKLPRGYGTADSLTIE